MVQLELASVTKSYGATPVLSNINLTVGKGQVISLIGASGSGKSTMLRCINGLEPIDDGIIVFEGDVVSGRGVDLVRLRRRIGMVFQSFNLFPHMSVMENCILAPVHTGLYSKSEARSVAMEVLERVGLSQKADAYPNQLSGGQQQRVAIARTMVIKPSVLLLDEVTSALDPELVIDVLQLIRELTDSGITLILATHEMAFAREISDRICFLSGGTILESGAPDQIFDSPTEDETKSFLRRVTAAGRL